MKYPYVPAAHFTASNRKQNTAIVVHTAECAESSKAAENLQAWTAGKAASQASWHFAVDADSVTQSVLEKDVAWHAGAANGWSLGIEHAGYASQGAAGWDDDFSRKTLELSARLAAELCARWSIPVRRLTVEEMKAGRRDGFCGHVDVNAAFNGGKGHVDPGPHFPWDSYLARVAELVGSADPSLEPPHLANDPVTFSGDSVVDRVGLYGFVDVAYAGSTWQVCPVYVAPIGIGAARDLAASLGCELPTPGLVDAIWRAADLKIDATKMVVSNHDGTPATMDSPATHERVAKRLEEIVGDRGLGRDFHLLAGAYKDVVQKDGKIGLYGWHRAGGQPIQSFFAGHAPSWRDYSQALRLVRKRPA
jgi:hypothetical protein